jgi:hypothetical protein
VEAVEAQLALLWVPLGGRNLAAHDLEPLEDDEVLGGRRLLEPRGARKAF